MLESTSEVDTLWLICSFSDTETLDAEVNAGASSSTSVMETTTLISGIAACIGCSHYDDGGSRRMDSKSWPVADMNLRVPEFTSNNVASFRTENMSDRRGVRVADHEINDVSTFSCMTAVESEVNTGAVSSASVMVTVNVVAETEVSALVAWTFMVQEVDVS